MNYAVIAWRTRNSATVSYVGGMQFVELTIAGGEKIVFGKGVIPDGQPSGLPAGYFGEFTKRSLSRRQHHRRVATWRMVWRHGFSVTAAS